MAIAAIVLFVDWLDSTIPNSTKGVTVVQGNTARVPQGEDFVVTDSVYCGNSCLIIHVWHITYDGQQTITFDEPDDDDHFTGTLCGVDCTIKVDIGEDMYATLRNVNGVNVVDVKWPQGWDYRPYEP